jgi:hypothetical protein
MNKPQIRLVILPFEIEAKLADSTACGGWDKRFKASIDVACVQLDEHGFVIENQTLIQCVRDYFAKAKYVASCEQLCQCLVHICYEQVGERMTQCKVRTYNLTGFTELQWYCGQEIPPLPVCIDL